MNKSEICTVNGKVLFLKVVSKESRAYSSFTWPKSGIVKPKEWDKSAICSDGLHGWAWGFGIGEGRDIDLINNRWIVFSAKPKDIVQISNSWKWKVREAEVLYNGTFEEAFEYIKPHVSKAIDYSLKSNNYEVVTNKPKDVQSNYNDFKFASNSYSHISTNGDSNKVLIVSKDATIAMNGLKSNVVTSGNYSRIAINGNCSKVITNGELCTIKCAKHSEISCNGDRNLVMCEDGSRVKVGTNGVFAIAYYDSKGNPKIKVGEVGKNGIKANTWYHVVSGRIVEVV